MNMADTQPKSVTPAFPADAVVVRRPHFSLKGDSLFFLISRRPFASLSAGEQLVWSELEKEAPVGALHARLGPSVDEGIRRLLELEVAELLVPPPPGRRRRVMVIEPHMDDAALSVGGLMLQRRAECEFLIVTLATQSLATVYRGSDREFFDIKTVSDLRKAESEIVARLLWGRHIPLGLTEATLRYNPQNWTLDWFRRHQYAIWMCLEHGPNEKDLEPWTSTLAKAIADLQPEEIWMPLGVGMHVDHQLTRHACLKVMRTNPQLVDRCVCRFYQDVPYAGDYREHTAELVKTIRDAGAQLEEEHVDITAEMQEKLHLLSVYSSQWKTKVIQVRVEKCAKSHGAPDDRYTELCYRVLAPPTKDLDMLATSAFKNSVRRVTRDVAPWVNRNKSAPVIGVLLAVPVGRWADDIQFLLDYFPSAHLELHLRPEFAAEAEMLSSPRVSVRVARNRTRFLADAVVTVMGRRLPLVIISGREREKEGRSLARLGLLSDSVVAQTMSDFVLALQCTAKDDNSRRRSSSTAAV